MKNLKKVLALVLAFACAFTMFASAAFTDEADFAIDTEVVDVLVSLGVIEGYTDGSFQPNGTVTRAEMAKMIYVVRTGKSDASAYNNDTTTFTDINSHWARGYIKYCQALGVIAGKSTTIFDPDATVTTQEAAKMLLVTLGYDAEKAGLVGTGWGNRTTALADENGLLEDVDCGATSGAPRQYAAQLIYNAIFAPTVVLRDGEYTNQSYVSEKGYVSYNATVGEKYMDLAKVSAGILMKVEEVEGKDYFTITTSKGTYEKVPTDVSDLMGQEIKVLQKKAKDSDKNNVYGVYADDDSKVIATGYMGTLKLVDSDATKDKIKLNGTEYKLENAANALYVYTVNTYNTSSDTRVAISTLNYGNNDGGIITAEQAASEIKLIDNDGNGKVDFAVQYPVKAAKVTAVSSSSFTVKYLGGALKGTTSETIDFDDAETYSGLAKDDYVTIFDDKYRPYDTTKVEKIDVTTGKITSTRTGEARVDGGDWLKWTAYVGGHDNSTLTTNSTYDLTIYGGVILDTDETAASSESVAYISWVKSSEEDASGSSDTTVKVRMYFQDGTNSQVQVSKVDGDKVKAAGKAGSSDKKYADVSALNGQLVTYSKLSDGTYDVKAVYYNSSSDKNIVGMDSLYTSSNANIYNKQKLAGYTPADDAVIFVNANSGDEIKVLTGKQVKNWADTLSYNVSTSGMLLKKSSGINYVKFAVLNYSGSKVPGATNDTKYAYLTTDAYQGTKDGEKKAAYEVWTGSESVTLYEDASQPVSNASAGKVISYTVDGNWIDDVTVLSNGSTYESGTRKFFEVAITGTNSDQLAYRIVGNDSSIQQYDFDDDCVYIAMNDKDNEKMEGGKANLVEANTTTVNNTEYYKANAYVVLEQDGSDWNIVAVVFDTNKNELDCNHTTIK